MVRASDAADGRPACRPGGVRRSQSFAGRPAVVTSHESGDTGNIHLTWDINQARWPGPQLSSCLSWPLPQSCLTLTYVSFISSRSSEANARECGRWARSSEQERTAPGHADLRRPDWTDRERHVPALRNPGVSRATLVHER